MASRKLEDLYSPLREVIEKAILEASQKQLPILITCTLRDPKEQEALYAQGRQSLTYVNKLRKEVNLPPITEQYNKRKVTWTRNSYHNTLPKSMAVDFAIGNRKKVYWNIKTDVNTNEVPDYREFASICKNINPENIQWGGDWDNPDYCHLQWKNGIIIDQNKKNNSQNNVKETNETKKQKENPPKKITLLSFFRKILSFLTRLN